MTLRVHRDARQEAIEGANFYEQRQVGLGRRFTDIVQDHLGKIERTPKRYATLETLRLKAEIRRCLLPTFPYLIVYEVLPDAIHVLAVAHASRRPNYWVQRRRSPSE